MPLKKPNPSDAGLPVSRREMLSYLWLSALGILTVQVFGMAVYSSIPRFKKGQYGGQIEVGPVTELPAVNDPPENHPKGKFWLIRTESGLSALYKACTHLDCLFSWNNQENLFICPCHGSRFARDGSLLSGPATRPLDRFAIQIVSPDGRILSETDPATGAPVTIPVVDETPQSAKKSTEETDANPESGAIVRVDTSRKIRILAGN